MHRSKRKNHERVRSSGFAVAVAAAAAVLTILGGSCFFDAETKVCGVSGLRCPLGWVCSADQKSCIQGGCGDGSVSGGEACDDGNVEGGDGCSADCLSNETCGNGIMDPEESCDDGRNDDGDGCSAACAVEGCGNGGVDLNEQCDPGMPLEDTAACDIDCSFIMCGDGYVNAAAGEQCDTGDPENPDPNNTPNTETCNGPLCTLSACGDSYYNPEAHEDCDTGGDSPACNGNDADGDPVAHCKIPRCGDRYTNEKLALPGMGIKTEECDNGGMNDLSCDFDCTKPVCGDGLYNEAAEECEDGNFSNSDSCVSDAMGVCRTAKCGDGERRTVGDKPETCDDGNQNTEDACPSGPTGNCQDAKCGDGYINKVDNAEICDPGNQDMPQVGCDPGQTCVSTGNAACKQCIAN